jgi:hypothetical protein
LCALSSAAAAAAVVLGLSLSHCRSRSRTPVRVNSACVYAVSSGSSSADSVSILVSDAAVVKLTKRCVTMLSDRLMHHRTSHSGTLHCSQWQFLCVRSQAPPCAVTPRRAATSAQTHTLTVCILNSLFIVQKWCVVLANLPPQCMCQHQQLQLSARR